jgi:hypothetical protein
VRQLQEGSGFVPLLVNGRQWDNGGGLEANASFAIMAATERKSIMKPPKLDRHYDKVAELKKKLGNKATSNFPFLDAATLADKVVQKWLVESSRKFSKETSTGRVFSWSLGGGWKVASDHCVRYVMFDYSGGIRTLIGLGYDLRHWILEGNAEQVPWRVWFDTLTPGFPAGVKTKLQGKPKKPGLQDAFAFDGMYPFFVLVPPKYLKGLERLPLKDEDKYVTKLAKAVPEFLDDLYRK